jgi:hypothetical protein
MKNLTIRNLKEQPLTSWFHCAVREYRAKVRLGLLPRRKCVTVKQAIKS